MRAGGSRAALALSALVGGLLAAVAAPQSASALPDICSSGADNVHVLNPGFEGDWDDTSGWSGGVIPNGPNEIACIDASGIVLIDDSGVTTITLRALYVDTDPDSGQGGAVTVGQSAALYVNGPDVSVVDGSLSVSSAAFGGTGSVVVNGSVRFNGDSVLTSVPAASGAAWAGPHGTLDVPGYMELSGGGLSMRTGYAVGISGTAFVLGDGGFVTADWGTSTTIAAGGELLLDGDGGYVQGGPVAGQAVGTLVNAGTIATANGTTTTVVDAAYTQTATGAVQVGCCGALVFAGSQLVSGTVEHDSALGTGACGPGVTALCNGSEDPAVDPSSVRLEVNAGQTGAANVQVQELALPPATTDSRAIGNEVFAHADGLSTDPTKPATISLRFSQADVMSTPLNQVQVGHVSDAGVMTKTPDCVAQDLPPGASYCIVRPVTRTAQNTLVTIRTIETSRWRLRRTGPNEGFAQTGPAAPQGVKTALVAPFDGSAVRISWKAPANDGGAATTGYRVYRDGALVATTDLAASSFVVKNPGPGTHTLAVTAVNGIGEGVAGAASISVAQALQAPQGRGSARRQGRQAESRSEVEGAGGRGWLRDHQVQGRGVQEERARRSTPRSSGPAR